MPALVIQNVLLFDGDTFIEDGAVVVDDGRVTYSGSSSAVEHPEDAQVISKPGCTLIPGLIDSHIHGLEGNIECLEQSLRFGVTTVCDMHNDPESLFKLKKLANDKAKRDIYADFKCAGIGATIEDGWPGKVIELEYKSDPELAKSIVSKLPRLRTAEDGKAFVEKQVTNFGAEYIKLMHELGDTISMTLPRPPAPLEKSIVETAHAHGLIAVGHAFSFAGARQLLESGVDGLSHCFMDAPPADDDWLDLMRRNNAHCNPTLGCLASQVGDGDALQQAFTADPLSQRMLFDKRPRHNLGFAKGSSFDQVLENTRAMYQAGVPLVVGSDCAGKELGTAYGLGVHLEMNLLSHRIGLSPPEVLKSATSLTADRFKFDDRGRIAPGKKADLVLIEGDVRKVLKDEQVKCLPVLDVWREGVAAAVYTA